MTKQTKIIISVILSCILLLLLFVPSFAEETLISPGTYDFVDISVGFNEVVSLNASYSASVSIDGEVITFSTSPLTSLLSTPNSIAVFSGDSLSGPLTDFEIYSSSGQTIVADGLLFSYSLGIWSMRVTSDEGSTIVFSGELSSPPSVTVIDSSNASSDFTLWFSNATISINPPYSGNPFSDIMNLIVEALDVPLFGTFSLWDMLTTLCGLFSVVWLLKLLAGG